MTAPTIAQIQAAVLHGKRTGILARRIIDNNNPSIPQIIATVCGVWGVAERELASPLRHRYLIEPRFAAMYLCRRLTVKSLQQIGDYFRRDHSTVYNAIMRAGEQMAADDDYRGRVAACIAAIRG